MVLVVRAKMHSAGLWGGEAISLMRDSGMSSTGYFSRRTLSCAMTEFLCDGESISGSVAPRWGVKMLNQIFAISGRLLQKARNSSR